MSIYKDFPLEDEIGLSLVIKAVPVGSRVTCNPAPTNTDIDWLVLTTPNLDLLEYLDALGWEWGGSQIHGSSRKDSEFNSFKKDKFNLICTDDEDFYDKFVLASSVAKRLNLLEKSHRIILFQAILYGNEPT